MIGENHPNLRTFQFFLSKIKHLYDITNQLCIEVSEGQSEEELKEAFFDYIIGYCFKISVSYKNGTYEYDWSKNEEYKDRTVGKTDFSKPTKNYRFVDDFVVNGALDKDRAARMLRVYKEVYFKEQDIEAKSLNLIQYDWSTQSDKDVEKAITVVLQSLKDNTYQITSYSPIIGSLLTLEEIGFDTCYLQSAIDLMKKNIDGLVYRINIDTGYSIDGENGKRHKEIIRELQIYADNHCKEEMSNRIGQYIFKEDGWAREMFDYMKSNQIEIINTTGFLSQLNIDGLVSNIAISNSHDINAFRACINLIYKEVSIGAALESEDQLLGELLESIKRLDTSSYDKIKTLQIEYLEKNLEAAIALYSVEDKPEQQE